MSTTSRPLLRPIHILAAGSESAKVAEAASLECGEQGSEGLGRVYGHG